MFLVLKCDILLCLFMVFHRKICKPQLFQVNASLVSSVCTRGMSYRGRARGLLTCYPDTDLASAKELMEAKGIKQLPVVKRGGEPKKERKRSIVAILHYDSIWNFLRCSLVSQFMVIAYNVLV